MRTFTLRVLDEPTRSISPISSTRSSFACRLMGTLAISSRNKVPLSASSKRPTRSVLASVKAPLTCPKSSLSKIPSAKPPAFTVTRILLERSEMAWRVWAITSLPEPGSPVINTLASDGPTREINCRIGCIAGDSAIRRGRPSARRRRFSASRRWLRRNASLRANCVFNTESRRAFSQGLRMKSRAPRRIASTASSTLPQAVITITGIMLSMVWMRVSRSRPSWPEVVSRV